MMYAKGNRLLQLFGAEGAAQLGASATVELHARQVPESPAVILKSYDPLHGSRRVAPPSSSLCVSNGPRERLVAAEDSASGQQRRARTSAPLVRWSA
jgi:hypothetical protein